MNGNEGVDLNKELFVNHGWESLRLFGSINPSKIYNTHVKMSEGKEKLWTGDITILDGNEIVGQFGGVAVSSWIPYQMLPN
jgi:naphtho-gamma-pyrone polyketide synthase